MIVVDVNLLLYAVVTGFPQHSVARAWWEATLNGPVAVGLTAPAVFGFLRLSTNPRVLTSPLPMETALAHVQNWLDRPRVRFLPTSRPHLEIAFDLLRGVGTAGNLTTDVQLAAHAITERAEMHSNDADFARFPDVRWVNPLAQ